MAISSTLFGIQGDALVLRNQRMAMLASNIANAATPNYKARDIDFNKALGEATSGNETEEAVNDAMGYRVPIDKSIDGNTVELPTEQAQFAENGLKYRSTLTFIQDRMSDVMSSLKGE
ncbi:flagellar basal-body rod protein FlgB [Zymomonas mobilis subsp. mobilis ZM4 = ATCC 31821]|uniref:Flagellar basal body rod protein FlgB n=3 Tax=Zymomonas mobilis TaxID=542 RepID=H2VFS4_ZYMMO|nr:flagellar basal body rod protein FlgB [Zymomonas mobilis]AAD19729.1 flagellar basal-body rod protein [Zymomonas mobilis subsp. mobilis ZM4 = ATCC 31821]AAV89238.1 flagellar basal-body rod protein FlgB [Zymomonas mobilis subsp. mobilis ZM4 = ATCC 31821]ACV75192.1 flagellar basal-body rod protein FlgB [Zymomonas mobilis subsp. mobilis NCIMB 11163]AEH62969.1 flagellar basal-body rod protein FlgB [Zymomonas mobilis subsp. mobilis ATCC 10988]AEJ83974.1 flagellar protein FlgB [Zymomonas mobilis]